MSPLVVIVVSVLVVAGVAGYLMRPFLSGEREHDHPLASLEGLSLSELVVPARTLATLVLAFAVVTVHESFEDVGQQAATEAAAVLSMGEDSLLLAPDASRDVLGQVRCYARSVVGSDWQAQAEGAPSPVTDAAADRVTLALRRAAGDPRNATAIGAILDDNAQRTGTRLLRFEDGRPSVPAVVWVLLLLTMATLVVGLAATVRPGVRRTLHTTVLVVTMVVFGLALLVIDDLDHPYSGAARVDPTAMQVVEGRLATLSPDPVPAPCDALGRPG